MGRATVGSYWFAEGNERKGARVEGKEGGKGDNSTPKSNE